MYENYPARFPKVASRHEMSLFNVAASVAPSGTVPKRPLRGRRGWGWRVRGVAEPGPGRDVEAQRLSRAKQSRGIESQLVRGSKPGERQRNHIVRPRPANIRASVLGSGTGVVTLAKDRTPE